MVGRIGYESQVHFVLQDSAVAASHKAQTCANVANPHELWIGYQNQPNRFFYKDPGLLYPEAQEIAGTPSWQQDGYVDSLRHCFIKVYEYIREEKHLQNIQPGFATFETGHRIELILQEILNSAIVLST